MFIHNNMIISRYRFITIIYFLFLSNIILAQDNFKYSLINNHKASLRTIKEDFKYVVSSPLRMSKKDRLKLILISGITSGLIFNYDEKIDNEFIRYESQYFNTVGKNITEIGRVYGRSNDRVFFLCGGISISLYLGSKILKDKKMLKTSYLVSESFIFSLIISGPIKLILGRSRPYMNKGSKDFNFLAFSQDKGLRSMPSIHTSSAFAILTVIVKQYDYWWVKLPSYLFLSGVAIQRIHDREHWASDVIVGGLSGYTIANILIKNDTKKKSKRLSFHPFISRNRIGASITLD